MGNSPITQVRRAIQDADEASISKTLESGEFMSAGYIDSPLNRNGDTALILSVRCGNLPLAKLFLKHGSRINHQNAFGETALDVAMTDILPADRDILHQHSYSPPAVEFDLPEMCVWLLDNGAISPSLYKLVLYVGRDARASRQLISLMPHLSCRSHARLASLCLQLAAWYDHMANVRLLLEKGVDPEVFWKYAFMPKFTCTPPRISARSLRGPSGDYEYELPEEHSVSDLKFAITQEWQDVCRDTAVYRAWLHLPPPTAIMFVQAAHKQSIMSRTMLEGLRYPTNYATHNRNSDPDLHCLSLILQNVVCAGYKPNPLQLHRLQASFSIDIKHCQQPPTNAFSLKHLCRLKVRHSLKVNVFCAMDNLPDLPVLLKNYILMLDI